MSAPRIRQPKSLHRDIQAARTIRKADVKAGKQRAYVAKQEERALGKLGKPLDKAHYKKGVDRKAYRPTTVAAKTAKHAAKMQAAYDREMAAKEGTKARTRANAAVEYHHAKAENARDRADKD